MRCLERPITGLRIELYTLPGACPWPLDPPRLDHGGNFATEVAEPLKGLGKSARSNQNGMPR